jgi:hypothetical protein
MAWMRFPGNRLLPSKPLEAPWVSSARRSQKSICTLQTPRDASGGLVQTEAASEADFCSRAVLIAGVERSLNFSLARSQSCEKHTSEPVQLPIAIALLKSFSQGFRLVYCLKSF